MKTKLTWFDRIMAAATFAEANEHRVAKQILDTMVCVSETGRKCKECEQLLSSELNGAEAHS
jgi:hypothetical protein